MLSPTTMNVSQKRKRSNVSVDSQQGLIRPRPQRTSTGLKDCGIDKSEAPRQECTEGPARFTLGNDGSKDCIALLVPETFIEKLADLFEWERKISAMEGPLYHARGNARDLEASLDNLKTSPEAAKAQESAEALGRRLRFQESDLQDIRRRLKQLEEAYSSAELESSRARNHTQYVLESAMEAAGLLRNSKPAAPQKAPPLASAVDHGHDSDNTGRNTKVVRQASGNPNSQTEPAESPEELARQEALQRLDESWSEYARAQAQFDNRNDLYDHNLAEYQRRAAGGECLYSRSEFDRKAVVLG